MIMATLHPLSYCRDSEALSMTNLLVETKTETDGTRGESHVEDTFNGEHLELSTVHKTQL